MRDFNLKLKMSSQRYTKALLSGATAFRSVARQQVRHNSQVCMHSRSLSLAAAARNQLAVLEAPLPGTGVVAAVTGDKSLRIKFSDGSAREVPYTWLRDNCRCHACSGTLASGNLHSEVYPEIIQSNEFGVVVDWSDGHISKYSGLWLHDHTLMSPPRTLNRILHAV